METTTLLTSDTIRFTKPLKLTWNPKEDITAYELAKCLPILLSPMPLMPHEINTSDAHMRHFDIKDPNKVDNL